LENCKEKEFTFHEEKGFSSLDFSACFKNLGLRYYGFCVARVQNLNQKHNKQLKYSSLLLDWRGISCTAKNLLYKLGFGITRETYSTFKRKTALEEVTKIEQEMDYKDTVFWIDNFNAVSYKNSQKFGQLGEITRYLRISQSFSKFIKLEITRYINFFIFNNI